MKGCAVIPIIKDSVRNERGSTVYSFLGIVIIALVIITTIFFFPWGQVFKERQDPDFLAGEKALADKHWEQAVSLFGKSLKSNPANALAYVGRSRAYLLLGNLDKALEDANTAVEKTPSPQAYGQRGIIEKLQKKSDEALRDFSEAIKLDSGYSWAYAQRADIYSRQKDQEKALQDVNKALAIKRDFVEGHQLKAWVLNRMGKCKDASEEFKIVEKLSPNDAWSMQDEAWFRLTCPDETLQDSSKAMELARKALELTGGKDGLVHETLAEAYFRQGDPLKAVEHQKKAIQLGSQKCPDRSCAKEMEQRLQKYEMAARQEVRTGYEILPRDSGH
ncbi:MAG: tetratricopeptide repeat protein [Desulfomonilaceae bacterium]